LPLWVDAAGDMLDEQLVTLERQLDLAGERPSREALEREAALVWRPGALPR
jgi:hypothetical protein